MYLIIFGFLFIIVVELELFCCIFCTNVNIFVVMFMYLYKRKQVHYVLFIPFLVSVNFSVPTAQPFFLVDDCSWRASYPFTLLLIPSIQSA